MSQLLPLCIIQWLKYIAFLHGWLLQMLITLIGFIIGFGIYGPVSLYGVMAIEAAPTHLSGTSHAVVSLACNSKGCDTRPVIVDR